MALFSSYAPPGVYTSVVLQPTSAPLFGSARIPVIIGEGVENFVFDNIEIFRGSSATNDDQSVNEDISAQVTGLTNMFQTTYFPITNGAGTGTVTNDPTLIQVTGNGIPVTVVSLNGAAGTFQTQDIIPSGTSLLVTYFFKRTDTLITDENESAQIPQFASFTYTIPGTGGDPVAAQLGAAAAYGILAAAGITNTGATVVTNGVIGSYPTSTITFDGGTATVDNVHAAAAQTAALAAYNFYNALTFTSLGTAINLSVLGNGATPATYTPGNYSSTSSIDIPTSITLDAQGNSNAMFVFKATASTITLESGASIILANGAKAENVIWIVGSSFTSVATSNMVGNILANTSITLGGGTLNGRALAGIVTPSGAVTIAAANSITVPPTSVATPGASLVISLTIPGELGNNITLAFTDTPGHGQPDATAVSGVGTNNISIELLEADNTTVRTLANISALIAAGIPTTYGYLTGSSTSNVAGLPQAASPFTGGLGPSTNTVFKTSFVPIVDGTNGGIITTNPANVTALVNGVAVTVAAVNGANGLVTLANPVPFGSTLTITYYTNTWQNTFDLLPANNIVQIDEVGLGPNRADFINNVDYILSDNKIYWGAATVTETGTTTAGSTAFGPLQITTTLRDENVYLVPATGVSNGVNAVFTSAFIPVDGSGLSRVTDNPGLISVYVGPDPLTAEAAGPVKVAQLSGATGTITLYNPPALNQNVYVSGYRSILNDNVFTLTVVNPSIPGQGSYSVEDQLGRPLLNITGTKDGAAGTSVADLNFNTTGIVWPFNFPDIEAAIGGADETITLTFQQDGLTHITSPATQAHATVPQTGSDSLVFTATTPGVNTTTNITVLSNATWAILPRYLVYTSAGTFYGTSGVATPFAVWQANHTYVAGQIIYDPNTLSIQVVTTSGMSGAGSPPPVFSATPGTTTADNTVTWTSNGLAPTSAEQIFINIVATTGALTLNGVINQFTGTIGSFGNVVTTPLAGQVLAALGSGSIGTDLAVAHAAVFFAGGVNATTIPISDRFLISSSRTAAQAQTDGLGRTGNATTPSYSNAATKLYAHSTAFSLNDTIIDTNGNIQQVTTAGTSGVASPVWATSGTTVDGGITWTFIGPVVGLSDYLGQTYFDPNTAVKFTIVDPNNALPYGYTTLPSPTYFFKPGDKITFVLERSTENLSAFVTGSIPIIAIPGLRTEVATTFGMVTGNTATVQTFNKSGNDPSIGEFYYVTFETAKQPSDFAIQIYENAADAYAVYGQPTVANRVSLGIQFMTQNGAQQFGVVQVPKQTGQPLASDQSFIAAIQSLATTLPGGDLYAAVIVPLSTSATVQSFLSRFLITQAAPRIQAEAIGFIGYSQFTTTSQARQSAMGLLNSRIIAVAPFVAGVMIAPTNNAGPSIEYAVSGEFLAAALAGLEVNPANDVATTLTNQSVVGFTRLLGTKLDGPTMDLMAASGLTLLIESGGSLLVRHYKSTDPSNVLTSEPTTTTITDYVRQQFRTALNQFIGRKFVGTLVNDVTAVCNSLLRLLVNQEIIAGYSNLTVVPDPSDPTLLDITVNFQPVFSLLYISVTFTVTTSL
jgi:hypothetical protein